ncbi:hypothetical protein PR202_ga28793 [Eleusine coracana subsp. coracana]|uniref:Uncharacterized protein n=1 Tax=Eleusine coracana subsp. coracana TaxID=191504 RepID=A0AAV5DI83_ELECO|nr:hypothetical protein PR202_ga28793 [Eleusine coracana subsp. coracana]
MTVKCGRLKCNRYILPDKQKSPPSASTVARRRHAPRRRVDDGRQGARAADHVEATLAAGKNGDSRARRLRHRLVTSRHQARRRRDRGESARAADPARRRRRDAGAEDDDCSADLQRRARQGRR